MLAFHGDKKIKSKYLARVRAHRKADNLIRGEGWTGTRGCAVGCTLEAYDHSRYPIELGIPALLARLEDRMFEGMPKAKAPAWPAEFLSAVPVGADLSEVWPKFAMWLLKGVRKHARPDGKAAIDAVVGLYRERAPVADHRWFQARNAAADAAAAYAAAYAAANAANAANAAAADAAYAAAYAAYAAAAYAAADAAYAAAYAAANAANAAAAAAAANAANAANAAAYAAARTGAREGHYYRQSRRLLELLRRAPVRKAGAAA